VNPILFLIVRWLVYIVGNYRRVWKTILHMVDYWLEIPSLREAFLISFKYLPYSGVLELFGIIQVWICRSQIKCNTTIPRSIDSTFYIIKLLIFPHLSPLKHIRIGTVSNGIPSYISVSELTFHDGCSSADGQHEGCDDTIHVIQLASVLVRFDFECVLEAVAAHALHHRV